MKLKMLFFFLIVMSFPVFEACDDDDDDNKGAEGKNKTILHEITYSNLAEIDLGQLAVSKGTNSAVKSYAQMMIQDHQKAQNDLDTVADNRNIDLPSDLKPSIQSLKSTLSALSGQAFDSAYINSQISLHTETRNLFIAFLDTSTDMGLREYINRYLNPVTLHLQKADSIANTLE